MLLSRRTRFQGRFVVPPVPDDEIAEMPARRARLARLYNRLTESSLLRWPLLGVGPFFRYTGTAPTLGGSRRGDTRAT